MASIRMARMQMASSRRRIDQLDRAIVRLLNERAKEAALVGSLKRDLGLPVCCRERETAVLRNIEEANPGPLTNEGLLNIYRRVLASMRALQE